MNQPDGTASGKLFLAEWMCQNEAGLPTGPRQNFYTSGKKPAGWTRVAKGTYEGRAFRIFDRWGKQDVRGAEVTFITPEKYAVVWFDANDLPEGIEWRNLNDALQLGHKIATHTGNYFEPG